MTRKRLTEATVRAFSLAFTSPLSSPRTCAWSGLSIDGASTSSSSRVTRTTVALTRGCAHSCTTNSSARRSSGPPKNGKKRCTRPPVPDAPVDTRGISPGACWSTNSATSVWLREKTLRTKCECSADAEFVPGSAVRNIDSNGLPACTRGVDGMVTGAVVEAVCSERGGSQGTRTSCAPLRFAASVMVSARSSYGTTASEVETAMPLSSPNVRKIPSNGSV